MHRHIGHYQPIGRWCQYTPATTDPKPDVSWEIKKLFLIFFAGNSGTPSLGGSLNFVHPAHPIVTPLPNG